MTSPAEVVVIGAGVAGLVQSGYHGGLNDGAGIVTSQPSAIKPSVLTQLVTMSAAAPTRNSPRSANP